MLVTDMASALLDEEDQFQLPATGLPSTEKEIEVVKRELRLIRRSMVNKLHQTMEKWSFTEVVHGSRTVISPGTPTHKAKWTRCIRYGRNRNIFSPGTPTHKAKWTRCIRYDMGEISPRPLLPENHDSRDPTYTRKGGVG